MLVVLAIFESYVEVLGVDLAVLGLEFLLRNEHALTEEVLVDELAVGLGDQPEWILVHCSVSFICLCDSHLAGGCECGGRRCRRLRRDLEHPSASAPNAPHRRFEIFRCRGLGTMPAYIFARDISAAPNSLHKCHL